MTYEINLNGGTIKLPKYSFKIAEKLEEQEKMNAGNSSIIDKCGSMYELFEYIFGKEKVVEILGEFNDCDPNEINILYLDIIDAYNSPLTAKQTNQTDSKLEKIGASMTKIDKVLSTLKSVEDLNKE